MRCRLPPQLQNEHPFRPFPECQSIIHRGPNSIPTGQWTEQGLPTFGQLLPFSARFCHVFRPGRDSLVEVSGSLALWYRTPIVKLLSDPHHPGRLLRRAIFRRTSVKAVCTTMGREPSTQKASLSSHRQGHETARYWFDLIVVGHCCKNM